MRGVLRLRRRDVAELDRELAVLGRGAGALRLRLGEALERLAVRGGHHACGFSSLSAYALERCERSGRWAIESRLVARRLMELPRLRAAILSGEVSWSRAMGAPVLRAAVCEGQVGCEAALLVARVATAKTIDAWLARAQERTIKHLREEVKAAELIGRVTGRGDIEPPDDETMNTVAALECEVLSGQVYRDRFGPAPEPGQVLAQPESMGDGQMSAQSECVGDGQMSAHDDREDADAPPARRGAGRSTLRLRVSDETYRVYRGLERDYLRRTTCPLGFLGFLCLSVWDSWHASLGKQVAYGRIYARDRYRCSSPVCTRGDVTPHHLRFRSHGGDDSADNVAALCVWCHLEGVHGGRIRALPPASDVRWTLGERPILVVHGRRKQEIGRAA